MLKLIMYQVTEMLNKKNTSDYTKWPYVFNYGNDSDHAKGK